MNKHTNMKVIVQIIVYICSYVGMLRPYVYKRIISVLYIQIYHFFCRMIWCHLYSEKPFRTGFFYICFYNLTRYCEIFCIENEPFFYKYIFYWLFCQLSFTKSYLWILELYFERALIARQRLDLFAYMLACLFLYFISLFY